MKKSLNYISYLGPGNIIEPLLQDNTKVVLQESVEPIKIATGNYKILPYETPSNLALVSEEKLKAQVNSDLNGKSKDEIKAIQQKIANAGYYDLFLHRLSKDQIIALQEKLKLKGLYKDKIDGIIGKNTINAYRQYNVDGIVGNRTREGYKQLLNPSVNYSYGATCTLDKGCAEFVTHSYNKSTDAADQNGVVGNAWRMPMNIVKAGGQEIYNIYSDPRFKKNRDNILAIRNLHAEVLSKNKLDLSSLKPGDVVGMYNPGSKYLEIANKEGTTFNSHVGLVVGLDADGMPIIEHNIHGNVKRERADRLGKRLISVAVRPNLQDRIPTINWDLLKSDYLVDEKIDNDNLKIYRDSMAGIAPTIAKIFPNAPTDKMQELALGILGRETGFMNDVESQRTGLAGAKRDLEGWVRSHIFREGSLSKSSDLTKTKFTSFTPEERLFLGINSPEDLNDPKKAGAAVLYLLSKNYNYLNDYQKTYPELGLTDEDKLNATTMSYNQGMSENSPARSWGFDSKTGARNDEEIETLRKHSDINQKVDSYGATKYAKVDRLLNFSGLKPGRLLYNLFGKDREGYAATANKNILQYIKKGKEGIVIPNKMTFEEWYRTVSTNKNDPSAVEFRNNYALDDSGDIYKYIPRKEQGGTINILDYLKEGSGIHIKKANRGKFTASAKAAGEGVQEHAHKVMNDPNATPLQRKRANFAIQAKRWHKHKNGGILNYLEYVN